MCPSASALQRHKDKRHKMPIPDKHELAIRRLCHRIVDGVRGGAIPYDLTHDRLVAIAEGREEGAPTPVRGASEHAPKHNLAEERQQAMERFYHELGLDGFEIPLPTMGGKRVSNREIGRRAQAGQALFYRPATSDVSYEAFMQAVGQGDHWTVTDEDERAKITWEPAETGYWFWAEIQDSCPRTGTCWNDLTSEHTLLCLEEYMIVWHVMRVLENVLLDRPTWCWLRTRYQTDSGSGALNVDEYDGRVIVCRSGPGDLSIDFVNAGGRVSEVVSL